MDIGERIRMRRIELGMTQTELAEKVGYSTPAALCRIEKGSNNLRQKKIKTFADALNTDPLWLMGITDEPFAYNVPSTVVLAEKAKEFCDKSPKHARLLNDVLKINDADIDVCTALISRLLKDGE